MTLALALLLLPTKTFAKDTATIAVSDAKAKAGETTEMVILVETNSGVSGVGLTVEYNTTALTLTDIRPLASGVFLGDLNNASFSWLKGQNLSGSFELAVLCFSIDASANGDYTVELKPIGDYAANITNEDANPVAATFVPGILSVVRTPVVEEPTVPEPSDEGKDPVTPPSEPDPGSTTPGEDPVTPPKEPEPGSTAPGEDPVTPVTPPSEPEKEHPQDIPSVPTLPTDEPKKDLGNVGLYAAVIAAAALGFLAGTVRKKRK